jgi:hypothetical protein
MNTFVVTLKDEIQDMGNKKLKEIEVFYKRYANDVDYQQLDTVEHNLRQIEGNKKPIQTTTKY